MQQKNKKDKFIKTVESVGVPGIGPGKSYTGLFGTVHTAKGYWSQDYVGQETFNTGRELYLRGPADDVTLRHYGACDICWSFGDAFCVTAPATVVRICKQWCRPHAQ